MTRPGIEPRSPGPLANTLTAGPMKPVKCHIYDTKQSDCESPGMLEQWRMRSTPSLPDQICPGVVTSERDISRGQIELFDI